jgi:hypothetical protein
MPIENWGEMTKSQIDATKIEERMTQMISEHNDDPTAHMADDQSIGLHRINDVLDHPQSSIVPDKMSARFPTYTNSFCNASSWESAGDATQIGDGSLRILTTSATHNSYIIPPIAFLEGMDFPTKGFLYNMAFAYYIVGSPTFTGLIGLGDDYTGFGFSINSTGIRAFYAVEGSITYSGYLSITEDEIHACRFFVDPVENVLNVWVDDVLLYTLELPVTVSGLAYQILFNADRPSGAVGTQFGMSMYNFNLYVG